MAWSGYFEYDGSEIINGPRTEAYLQAAGKGWFVPTFNRPDFATLIEQPVYTTPFTDGAPWVDPDLPESQDFYGFYPLEVTGAESSSRSSSVTEFTIDGGNPGRLRHGTKTLVFNGLIMAGSEQGAEYGIVWLRRALLGRVCSTSLTTETSLGADLTYFAVEPEGESEEPEETYLDGGDAAAGARFVPDPDDFDISEVVEVQSALRYMKNVVINSGPVVMSKRKMSCGGAVWGVQFSAVAGSPYEFGALQPLLQGMFDPDVDDPWVPATISGAGIPLPQPLDEEECGQDTWEPLFDPLCPALVAPPAPPSVPLGCWEPPAAWDRYQIDIPAPLVPLWQEVVPTVTLHAPDEEVRNVRLRFYADPLGTFDPSDNPCDYTGDVVVSYIPAGATMVLDGALQQVRVTTALGHVRRADSLVFATDGTPFVWPHLTCGYGHILTIDVDAAGAVPVVDLALTPRSR